MLNSQNNFDKKNYLVAILLSLIIILGWSYFFQPPIPPPTPTQTNNSTNTAGKKTQENQTITKSNPIQEITSQKNQESLITTKVTKTHQQENLKEKVITLTNDKLEITFSSKNAVITSSIIKLEGVANTKNLESDSHPVLQTGRVLFVDPQQNYKDLDKLENYNYAVVSSTRSIENGTTNQKVVFQRTFTFDNHSFTLTKTYTLTDYQVSLDLAFSGLAENQKINYFLINGSNLAGFDKEQSYFDIKHLAYNTGDDFETVVSPSIFDMFSTPKTSISLKENVDWLSIDDRFFARILKISKTSQPNQKSIFFFKQPAPLERLQASHPNQNLTPEDITKWEYLISGYNLETKNTDQLTFYFIPKKRDLLNQFFDQDKAYFFNLFHQFKFMRLLSSMMYWVLQKIYLITGSYGWAILLMTFLLKLVILPLTQRSMKSMEKMKLLSPKIEALKKNHKKDAKRLNQEMMALYKREKVNPLGGCIPMLIPLPIFLALYSLFQNMVELKGHSFYWITDLSRPDVIHRMDSALPFIGQNIHLLPLIMVITAFAQSLTSPQSSPGAGGNEMKQQMAMMKYFMPLFFFFISWNMPSALILYWIMQNAFSVGQTLFIRLSLKKEKQQ